MCECILHCLINDIAASSCSYVAGVNMKCHVCVTGWCQFSLFRHQFVGQP